MNRRNFIKSGALFVPTLLLPRKSLGQKLFDPNLGLGVPQGLSALNSDWLTRILAAGGARPSDNTFAANDVWYAALTTAGIQTIPKLVNTYAPDNLIACITPLIKGNGFDSWTNTGPFVSGDLTVNGLAGDGSTKYLKTGYNAGGGDVTDTSNHGTIYIHTDDKSTQQVEYGTGTDATTSFRCYCHYNDNTQQISNLGNFFTVQTTASAITGYLTQSRTSATRVDFYTANSGTGHSSIFNSTSNVAGRTPGNFLNYVHASNEVGTASSLSKKRISYLSMGGALTSSQSLAYFNAIQALRTSYGGGYT